MKSAPSIAFDYRPSRWIACATVAISVAACAAPWFGQLPVGAQGVISLGASAIGIAALRNFFRARFRRIAFRASAWKLVRADGVDVPAELASHVRLGAWLALDFRCSGRRHFRAVLGPDNIDTETRRRLILLLSRAEVAQTG
jgi:toxin CptA